MIIQPSTPRPLSPSAFLDFNSNDFPSEDSFSAILTDVEMSLQERPPEYTCEKLNGLYHGFGTIKYSNGSIFEGNICNNVPHGSGKWTDLQSEYVGNFRNGVKHGEGIFTTADQKLSGLFINDQFVKVAPVTIQLRKKSNQIARIFTEIYHKTYPDGPELKNGKPFGCLTLPNRLKYTGFLDENGVPEGSGVMNFSCAEIRGEFHGGLLHGFGKICLRVGEKMKISEGFFSNGLLHGEGQIILSDGTICKGNMENDFSHGKVIIKSKKMDVYGQMRSFTYEGNVKNGVLEGEGAIYYSNGEWTKGIFRNGNISEGRYQGINRWFEGSWKNGRLEGQGSGQFSDQRLYEGEWVNGLPHGKGIMKYPDGKELKGRFEQGQFVSDVPPEKQAILSEVQMLEDMEYEIMASVNEQRVVYCTSAVEPEQNKKV